MCVLQREEAWGTVEAARLEQVVKLAQAAAQILLTRLEANPEYKALSKREQGVRFSALVPDKMLSALLHQIRLGQLDAQQVRRIVLEADQLEKLIECFQKIVGEE